jgi:hypothetical protein
MLQKLLDISSASFGPENPNPSNIPPTIYALLQKRNGFYAFEAALHVFGSQTDSPEISIEQWNSPDLWRDKYGGMDDGCFFFAEDVFGVQFAFRKDDICTYEPETGQQTQFAKDLEDWAAKILADYNLHTGYSLAHEWQLQNGHLPVGKRLIPKVPFVAGGQFDIANLYAGDSVEAMHWRAFLAQHIESLPDGAKIEFKITE